MTTITLYGKPDCCLCDEAKAVLQRLRLEHPFELVELDITSEPRLERDYFDRIPVVEVDGAEAFEFHVDELELRRRLGKVG